MKFELARLTDHSDESLLAEMRRVVALIDSHVVTQCTFDELSKVHSSTIRKRFGGWRQALTLAGLGDRYSGATVSKKMLSRPVRKYTDDDMIAELKAVAQKLGSSTFTIETFNRHSAIHAESIRRRFGSWWAAMEKADLVISSRGKRYSEDDYFENLLTVWTNYGRQPKYREMDSPPSWISSGAYEAKWKTWTKALIAFIERVNADVQVENMKSEVPKPEVLQPDQPVSKPPRKALRSEIEETRTIRLGLRYEVLRRDRFRCMNCGRSPATDPKCQLHVDHKNPFSKGGPTTAENLQTLCLECNLGKSDRVESESNT